MRRFLIAMVISGNVFCFCNASAQSAVKDLILHKITVSYPDHIVRTFVKPVSGIQVWNDRPYYWFSGQQINMTQGGYSGKLLNGYYEDFYLNKNLKESGWFIKGLKCGVWKSWNEKGVLIAEYCWDLGKKNGAYHLYDMGGRQIEKGKFRNDVLIKQQPFFMDTLSIKHPDSGSRKVSGGFMPGFIKKLFKKNK